MTEIVAKFENKEDGIESYVTVGHMGYHVTLKDTDAGEFVGVALCYSDKDAALIKAKEII
jgi:hypothetical protein